MNDVRDRNDDVRDNVRDDFEDDVKDDVRDKLRVVSETDDDARLFARFWQDLIHISRLIFHLLP